MDAIMAIKNNENKKKIFLVILLGAVLGCFIEMYFTMVSVGTSFSTVLQNINILRLIALIVASIAILYILTFKYTKVGEFIHKYRFLIAGILLVVLVLFQVSGSSIGMWLYYVDDGSQEDDGTLLGESRIIRGDEWNVNTSMAFSQSFGEDSYSYYSQIIRGDTTDTYIIYGQPVKDISIIFRPFQIGYILFGNSYGLSFFWCSRLIALFLVTYEFGLLLTRKDRLLSLLLAVMITYAPVTQWWFAINGLVEMIVFMELSILMLQKYMTDNNLKRRILYLLVIMICAGGYILTFYPAWQVPLFFVLIGLAIWVIVENKKDFKINYKDVISIILVLVVFLVLMGRIVYKSYDTIEATLNTAYPGSRSDTGGGQWYTLFTYAINVFFSVDLDNLSTNVCEESRFFDLFPLGIILVVLICIYKKKKPDLFATISLVVMAFLGGYVIFGYPNIVCKLTLMSYTTNYRCMVGLGYLNVILLIYELNKMKEEGVVVKRKLALPISLIFALVIIGVSNYYYSEYVTVYKGIAIFILLALLCYLALRINADKKKKLFTVVMILVLFFSSFLVNPIRSGADVIYEQELSEYISTIVDEDSDALWIYEGEGMSNFLILNGARTINSTNVYPDLSRWALLDEEGKYENIYNRYAHITMTLCNAEQEEKFTLIANDSFNVNIVEEDLQTLNVSYILTKNDLSEYNNDDDGITFKVLYETSGYTIYKVEYLDEQVSI